MNYITKVRSISASAGNQTRMDFYSMGIIYSMHLSAAVGTSPDSVSVWFDRLPVAGSNEGVWRAIFGTNGSDGQLSAVITFPSNRPLQCKFLILDCITGVFGTFAELAVFCDDAMPKTAN